MSSTPPSDRFSSLSELFRQACETSPAGRTALLEETRSQDPALAEELQALLAADDTAASRSFLEPLPGVGPAVRRAAENVSEDDFDSPGEERSSGDPLEDRHAERVADHVGRTIGDFTLVRLIAQGGMGSVYVARQSRPAREVAIKLLRDELPSQRQRERFQLEAAVLARLQHPGIAAIHAAGTTDGRPWLAMEYVTGARPVTHHANEASLSTIERVRLLRSIADAVRHAHQRGVIHRDLKPANLIVGEDGRVRVIDFGVARADGLLTRAARQTGAGELLGTLAYMAPEQCTGDSDTVDIRSDVYALGLVLYELVGRRRAFDFEGRSLGDAIAQVSRHGVPPLEARDDGIDDDLRCIVSVATSLDPADRYQSVDALVSDMDRWLAREPIAARPPGPIRRVRLFVRRRRALSALIGTAAAATAAIAILVLAFTVQLSEQGRATRIALDRSERMLSFLGDVLGSASDANSDAPTRDLADVLQIASRRVGLEFSEDPAAEFRLREAIGRSWQTMGELDRAMKEFERQTELAETMAGAPPRLRALAAGNRAKLHFERDERALAEAAYRQAAALYREDPDTEPSSLLAAEQSIVLIEAWRGEPGAVDQLRELFQRARELTGPTSFRTVQLKQALASILVRRGRTIEAEELLREVVTEVDESFRGPHPRRIDARNALGWALVRQGRFDEGVEVLDEAVAMAVDLFGPTHPRSTWIRGTRLDALIRNSAARREGSVDVASGDVDLEAETRSLLADRLSELGPRSRSVAIAESMLWRVLFDTGRLAESLDVAESAHARTVAVLGSDHPDAARTLQLVGLTHLRLGDMDRATAMLEEARDIVVQATGGESRETALAFNELGIAYAGRGQWEQAMEFLRRAAAIYDRGEVEEDPERIKAHGNVGRCLLELGRMEEARTVLADAHRLAARVYTPGARPRVMIEASYGEVLAAVGAPAEARAMLESVIPRLEVLLGESNPRLGRLRQALTTLEEDAAAPN